MYRDLGLIRVWGAENLDSELRGVPYAYLIYPHKPIVAYLPQTGRLAHLLGQLAWIATQNDGGGYFVLVGRKAS